MPAQFAATQQRAMADYYILLYQFLLPALFAVLRQRAMADDIINPFGIMIHIFIS